VNLKHNECRLSRIAGALAATAGTLSWSAYLGRLQLRSLHTLQLEGYQTRRYLGWVRQRRERWFGASEASTVGVALLASGLGLVLRGRTSASWLGSAAWATAGAAFWWAARPGQATKPLVLTARAKRLLTAQSVLTLIVAVGPAVATALVKSARRQATLPALMAGGAAAAVALPLSTALANLMLWPVEEGFRRYYLSDARRTLRAVGPRVIGVAGSYGKTSTKELTATILAARWSVLRPPGSFNTPMGISRVIREQLVPAHEVFVAELGDYVPGDLRFLCNLVGPSVGILTTIGPEHLERFKTMERIVQTKEELIDALPPDGIAVVNQDDPLVRAIGDRAERRGRRVIRYGQTEPGAQVRARDVETTRRGLRFTVEADGHGSATFEVKLLGRHNVMNVLAATGAALALGMALPEVAAAARAVEPVEHRLQPIDGPGGVLVIDDTYNSNPTGAAEALRVLGELPGAKKVLVTPGMIELAEREAEEHRLLGQRSAAVCDEVILVGPERTRPIGEGLAAAGFPTSKIHVVENRDGATARLQAILRSGDVVLWENDLPDTYAEASGAASRLPVAMLTADSPGQARASLPDGYQATDVNGMRTVFREDGPADGPTVLVLHGWGASIAAVVSIQAALRGTHHTVALDLPGFGASDPPPVPWGGAEFAAHLRAFMRHRGITRASIIGHSHGGRTAIVLAATHPELVDKLVLVDSAGIRPARGAGYYARVYAFKAGRRLATAAARTGPLGAQAGRLLQARFGSTDYRQAGSMRGTLVRVVNEDWRHLLPKIVAPTLLIWGEHDDATPVSDGQLMERLIPDAGLVIFPGAGHFSYADDYDRFARVVGHFLAGD
jgi:UDP-N-acetylmuramoyl-tripeptide--D-alanyl-D-alanine ligase